MANLKNALKITWADNKKLMGANIRRFGCPFGADSDADASKASPRKDDDEELAFYHPMADEWYDPLSGEFHWDDFGVTLRSLPC